MSALGIVGTARAAHGFPALRNWRIMLAVARRAVAGGRFRTLVSGGAAWADHVAAVLFLEARAAGRPVALRLHLPCAFDRRRRRFAAPSSASLLSMPDDVGSVANELHRRFSLAVGRASLDDLAEALGAAGCEAVEGGGFRGRNARIAAGSDALLAFTAEGGPEPRDGGTRHTWRLFGGPRRAHVPLGPLGAAVPDIVDGDTAWAALTEALDVDMEALWRT